MRLIEPGDHIAFGRAKGAYWHHAVYLGNGQVVHYWDPLGNLRRACVRVDHWGIVAGQSPVYVINYGLRYPRAVVIHRALSRLGEHNYHLARNNCEAFARWALCGASESHQVERVASSVFGSLGTHAAARLGVSTLLAVGRSVGANGGAAVMAGLRSAGRLVVSGSAGGLGMVAAIPTAVATAALRRHFRDSEFLTNPERAARRIARGTALGASAAGVGLAVYAVSAAGIPGLSAVGISSGLAALGAAVGKGMLAGLGLVAVGPAVLAAGLSFLSYALFGGGRDRRLLLPGHYGLV